MRAKQVLLSSAAVLAPAALVCAPAHAQSALDDPGIRSPVDEHGVDMSTGNVVIPASSVSIGGANGLAHVRTRVGNGWRHNYLIAAEITSGASTAAVNMGGSRMTFNLVGGVYQSAQGTGETITTNFSTGTHTLTLRDGTEVVFKESYVSNGEDYYGAVDAVAETITRPDGHKTTLHYINESYSLSGSTIYVLRLQSVTNSLGYQLRYRYAQAGSPTSSTINNWYRVTKVTAINNAVDDCNPVQISDCSFSENWPSLGFAQSTDNGSDVEIVTDVLNRQTVFRFDSSDRLTGVKTPEDTAASAGFSVVYNYGGDNRVSSVVYEGDYTRTYIWSLLGSSLTSNSNDSLGRFRATATDTNQQNVTYINDASNNVTTMQYDSNGRLTQVQAPEGNKVQYTYDARGNLTQTKRIDKAGNSANDIVTTASYPSSCTNPVTCNLPTSTTDALGNVTNYTWDSTYGVLTRVQAPAPNSGDPRPRTDITYDNYRARFYNASGTLVDGDLIRLPKATTSCRTANVCTNSVNEFETLTYYPSSGAHNLTTRETRVRAGNGSNTQVTKYTYNALSLLETVDGPLSGTGDTTTYHYDDAGQVTGVISPDPDGSGSLRHLASRATYNKDGQVTLSETGYTTGTSAANLASMVVGRVFETTYDNYGRVKTASQISTNGSTRYSLTQYGYDHAGRPKCTAVRMNVTSTSTSLPSDACDAMSPTSGDEDRITRLDYNALDQVVQVWRAVDTSNQFSEAEFSYRQNGQVENIVDAYGSRTKNHYDSHDRLHNITYPSPTRPTNYDPSASGLTGAGTPNWGDNELFNYDKNGNLTSYRNRTQEYTYFTYDKLNRLTRKNVPNRSGLSTTHTRDVYYDYDVLGGLTEARFDNASFGASGDRVTFNLDALGRQTSTSQRMDGATRTISYQYDSANRRTRITHPDGTYWTYEYDTLNRMKRVLRLGSHSQILRTYNNHGQIENQYVDGSAPTQRHHFDAARRLDRIFIDHNSSSYDVNREYEHNAVGQTTEERVTNQLYIWDRHPSGSVDVDYVADGQNQYDSVDGTNFAYDSNGNLTSDGSTTFVYDVENRLVDASGGNNVDLRYDPLGRLYEIKDSGGNVERLLYDGVDLIAEYNGSGGMIGRYIHGTSPGDDPLIAYPGSSSSASYAEYLYTDRLGSIVAAFDRNGTRESINSYDEYGVPGASSSNKNKGRFRYTGQIYIPELGMYHYKARAYSPGLGRFMQTDPIGYGDGLNMYAYVRNDPANSKDPTGLCSVQNNGYWVVNDNNKDQKAWVRTAPPTVTGCDFEALTQPIVFGSSGAGGVGGSGSSIGNIINVVGSRAQLLMAAVRPYYGATFCGGATWGKPNKWNPNGRVNTGKKGTKASAMVDLSVIAAANGIVPLAFINLPKGTVRQALNSSVPVPLAFGWTLHKNPKSGQAVLSNGGLTIRYRDHGLVRIDIPKGFAVPGVVGPLAENETCHYRP